MKITKIATGGQAGVALGDALEMGKTAEGRFGSLF